MQSATRTSPAADALYKLALVAAGAAAGSALVELVVLAPARRAQSVAMRLENHLSMSSSFDLLNAALCSAASGGLLVAALVRGGAAAAAKGAAVGGGGGFSLLSRAPEAAAAAAQGPGLLASLASLASWPASARLTLAAGAVFAALPIASLVAARHSAAAALRSPKLNPRSSDADAALRGWAKGEAARAAAALGGLSLVVAAACAPAVLTGGAAAAAKAAVKLTSGVVTSGGSGSSGGAGGGWLSAVLLASPQRR
jgi:hypothetical protein